MLTKWARGLNFDEDETTNIALFLTEFNEFNNKQVGDLTTYHDVTNRPNKVKWLQAMMDEINTLQE